MPDLVFAYADDLAGDLAFGWELRFELRECAPDTALRILRPAIEVVEHAEQHTIRWEQHQWPAERGKFRRPGRPVRRAERGLRLSDRLRGALQGRTHCSGRSRRTASRTDPPRLCSARRQPRAAVPPARRARAPGSPASPTARCRAWRSTRRRTLTPSRRGGSPIAGSPGCVSSKRSWWRARTEPRAPYATRMTSAPRGPSRRPGPLQPPSGNESTATRAG